MNRIYLDVSALCRPFDDQSYARIRLETDAVNLILSYVKDQKLTLMKSPVHYKEINDISDILERIEIIKLLDNFAKTLNYNTDELKSRTINLYSKKFGIADAAHIAFAEYFESIFISCDYKLIKKCKNSDIKIECVNPVIYCEMEKLK